MKKEGSNLEWLGFSLPELDFICEALDQVQEQFPENAEEAYNIREDIQYQLGNRSFIPKKDEGTSEIEGVPV